MTVVNGYCSVDDVREQLGDTAAKLTTSLIEKSINAASRAIDRYCSRRFWQDKLVTTRVYVPEDSGTVYINDVSTKTGLIIKTDEGETGTYSRTWAATEYQLEPLNQEVVAAGDTATAYAWWRIRSVTGLGFPGSLYYRPTVSVTARFGWSAIPDDVSQACVLKAVSIFRRKDAPFGVAGFGDFGAVKISRSDPDVVGLLGPYMIPGT